MTRLGASVWTFRVLCAVVLVAGAGATLQTHEERWIERSGDVLVALALLLTYAQFRYEVEHSAVQHAARDSATQLLKRKAFVTPAQEREVLHQVETTARERYNADRAYILLNALATAAIGELVSAFGGLALQLFS